MGLGYGRHFDELLQFVDVVLDDIVLPSGVVVALLLHLHLPIIRDLHQIFLTQCEIHIMTIRQPTQIELVRLFGWDFLSHFQLLIRFLSQIEIYSLFPV